MKRVVCRILAVTALVAAVPFQAHSQMEEVFGGRLTLPDGVPVAGYPIILQAADESQVILTDEEGRWAVTDFSVSLPALTPTGGTMTEEVMVQIPNGPSFGLERFRITGPGEEIDVVLSPYQLN